jgi:type IV pilus modification protein PilV
MEVRRLAVKDHSTQRNTRGAVGTARRRDGGFTLIEVLVALFVLAVGLLGLASLQLNASNSNGLSGLGTRAVLIAQARMEMLKSARFVDIKAGNVTNVCQTPVQIKNDTGTPITFYTVTCTYSFSDTDHDGTDDLADMEVSVTYPPHNPSDPAANWPVHLVSSRTSA